MAEATTVSVSAWSARSESTASAPRQVLPVTATGLGAAPLPRAGHRCCVEQTLVRHEAFLRAPTALGSEAASTSALLQHCLSPSQLELRFMFSPLHCRRYRFSANCMPEHPLAPSGDLKALLKFYPSGETHPSMLKARFVLLISRMLRCGSSPHLLLPNVYRVLPATTATVPARHPSSAA